MSTGSTDSKLEASIITILRHAGVPVNEVDACLAWAFGPRAWYRPIYPDWIDSWNKRHPTAFRASRKDKFVELIYVIGTLYLTQKMVAMRKRNGVTDAGEV